MGEGNLPSPSPYSSPTRGEDIDVGQPFRVAFKARLKPCPT